MRDQIDMDKTIVENRHFPTNAGYYWLEHHCPHLANDLHSANIRWPDSPLVGCYFFIVMSRRTRLKTKLIGRVLCGALLLATVLLVSWLILRQTVLRQLERRLSIAGLGPASVGSLTIGPGGLEARNVTFSEKEGPVRSIDALQIRHPLFAILADNSRFDRIEIQSPRVVLDRRPDEDRGQQVQRLLREFQLPAREVAVRDLSVSLPLGEQEVHLQGIDATLTPTGNGIRLQGTAEGPAGNRWQYSGEADNSSQDLAVRVESVAAAIHQEQWQDLPGVPESLRRAIQGDVQADIQINLSGNLNSGLEVDAVIRLKPSRVTLTAFQNLGLQLFGGELRVADELLTFDAVEASTNGTDRIVVSGTTQLSGDPVVTEFHGEVGELDVAVLRKLVNDIPDELSGQVSGPVEGRIEVDSAGETRIELESRLRSSATWYGLIFSPQVSAAVSLSPLVLDSDQSLRQLQGSVGVGARIENLALTDLLATFGLQELSQALELQGTGNGFCRLDLPLQSAADLASWKMDIDAQYPAMSILGESLSHVRAEARLENGLLAIAPIRGQPESAAGELEVRLGWPLDQLPAEKRKRMHIELTGWEVSDEWLAGIIDRQLVRTTPASPGDPLMREDERWSGRVNLQAHVTLPLDAADDVHQWEGRGAVHDSVIGPAERQLAAVNAVASLRDGWLQIDRLRGSQVSGTALTGSARLALTADKNSSGSLQLREMPVRWLATVLVRFVPQLLSNDVARHLAQITEREEVAGPVSGELKFESGPSGEQPAWSIDFEVNSTALEVHHETLFDVMASGSWSTQVLQVREVQARLGEDGFVNGAGQWNLQSRRGSGHVATAEFPLPLLFQWFESSLPLPVNGRLDARLDWSTPNEPPPVDGSAAAPFLVEGQVEINDAGWGDWRLKHLGFDVVTSGNELQLVDFRGSGAAGQFGLRARIGMRRPWAFAVEGKLQALPLSQMLERMPVDWGREFRLTGVAQGEFLVDGTVDPPDWRSRGNLNIVEPRVNHQRLADVRAEWSHHQADWQQSRIRIDAFGGRIEMIELGTSPERVAVEIEHVDAWQISQLLNAAVDLSGWLSGRASFNEWSLDETRWAELELTSASVIAGRAELGDFAARAEYRNQVLEYDIEGQFLGGRLAGSGRNELHGEALNRNLRLPLTVRLSNARLQSLTNREFAWQALQTLQGNLDADVTVNLQLDEYPSGEGRLEVNNVKWRNELVTRDVKANLVLTDGQLFIEQFRADLQQGELTGRAGFPLFSGSAGTWELDVRRFNLRRMMEVLFDESLETEGLLDARLSGQFDRQISGRGVVGVDRTRLAGVQGEALRLPIQFRFSPLDGSGRVELRRSRFQFFQGNAAGTAFVDFRQGIDLMVDVEMSDVDSHRLLASLTGIDASGRGQLSGRLRLQGRSMRHLRDLSGSFLGVLNRSEALRFPVLSTVASYLNRGQLARRDYQSDEINLQLANGRIDVRQLNLYNSLARFAVRGLVYLDGRLDLQIAARIEQLNQPTLLDQFLESPLARFQGTPAAFFARATDFLSDRVVFLQVGGTFRRPRVQPDSGRQIREELVRYFLGNAVERRPIR